MGNEGLKKLGGGLTPLRDQTCKESSASLKHLKDPAIKFGGGGARRRAAEAACYGQLRFGYTFVAFFILYVYQKHEIGQVVIIIIRC